MVKLTVKDVFQTVPVPVQVNVLDPKLTVRTLPLTPVVNAPQETLYDPVLSELSVPRLRVPDMLSAPPRDRFTLLPSVMLETVMVAPLPFKVTGVPALPK
jgi:hypothetical protein